ncbi:MAG: SH3 domain-containing protein [Geminicoccaceae bacterium]
MRSIAGSRTLIAILLLACPLIDHAAAAPGDVFSTNKTNVNVRVAPSTSADILARVNPGETLIEIDTKDDWHLVKLPGNQRAGWVFSSLLEQVRSAPEPSAPEVNQPSTTAIQPSAEASAPDKLASRTTAFDDNLVGNPTNGKTVFYKCGACHTTVPGVHAEGPSLVGVFGRSPAQAPGYRYSGAMQSFARMGGVWDEATLDRFIQRPPRVVKGTTMPFSGVRDQQDRRDLIAYLRQL